MKKLTPQQIREIGSRIVGPFPSLWIPDSYSRTMVKTGPEFIVVRTYSELTGQPRSAEEFFDELNTTELEPAILALSAINIIVGRLPRDQGLHQALAEKFLGSELRSKPLQKDKGRQPDSLLLFNRIGVLAALKGLIGITKESTSQSFGEHRIGNLVARANDFITSSKLRDPAKALDDLDLGVEMVPTWELTNERDLAYSLVRMYLMIVRHLPSNDELVTKRRNNIGLDPTTFRFDGILLEDFVAIVFGLYGHVMSIDPPKLFQGIASTAIDATSYLSQTGFPQDIFQTFLQSRSVTLDALRHEVTGGRSWTKQLFAGEVVTSDDFATDFLTFRRRPLLDIGNGKHLIIDIQFVAELLFTGLFFEVFFSLHTSKREEFLSLWGRIFELYLHDLLEHFYPAPSSILRTDIEYDGGQIDAFLDFGSYVVILEFKFFLLEHSVKHGRDSSLFGKELQLKLVENEEGKPKALRQLSESARAVFDRRVSIAQNSDRDIYPVVVVYEPCLESVGINSFLNKKFQTVISGTKAEGRIKPLTVMTVQEIEQVLPQTQAGHLTWRELLESRFDGTRVKFSSIHQGMYDLLKEKNQSFERNQFLLDQFDSIYKTILARYGIDEEGQSD